MSDEFEGIISEFIIEAMESLDKIEPLFVELEQKGHDTEILNSIFRSMHTIKGAAGFLGLQSIVNVAHASENILKKLRDNEIILSKLLTDAILKSVDMLRLQLQHLNAKDRIEENTTPLIKKLENALKMSQSGQVQKIEDKSESQIMDQGSIVDDGSRITDNLQLTTESDAPQSKEPPQLPTKESLQSKESAHTLRVDVDRIDAVMNLAGEIVLARNRLLNLSNYFQQIYANTPRIEELSETVSFLDRVTSDIQIAVMKMRMQPIQRVFNKFPRLVRDISNSLKKDVELQIYGEDTEVDKSVIEHIGDPMTHILRNSIDHGIESVEERIAKGKPPKGKIIISAYQKGNQIVIEVSDDGKGMDIEKLKQKAIEKGLITEDEAQKMTDANTIDIIFLPGFSTKDVATDISGRGVGMDVVKTNISLLNGYVDVATKKDKGTTFRITLPLTLAIMQALMVEVSGAKYAIPLSHIEETLRVSMQEIKNITGQNVIVIRDRICPLFELNDILGINHNGDLNSKDKYIVVISLGDKRFCLAVDNLLGQEDIVIKTLEGMGITSDYVLGTTITGDGRVVFILDPTAMSRSLLGITKV